MWMRLKGGIFLHAADTEVQEADTKAVRPGECKLFTEVGGTEEGGERKRNGSFAGQTVVGAAKQTSSSMDKAVSLRS